MNYVRLVVALVFLAAGMVVGVLNTQPITLRLLFTDVETSSGVAIILALLSGVLIVGAIVLAALVLPMYAKLRKAQKASVTTPTANPDTRI